MAVQKTAPDYDPEKGSKWSMRQLRLYLTAKHGQDAVSMIGLMVLVPLDLYLYTFSSRSQPKQNVTKINTILLNSSNNSWLKYN